MIFNILHICCGQTYGTDTNFFKNMVIKSETAVNFSVCILINQINQAKLFNEFFLADNGSTIVI